MSNCIFETQKLMVPAKSKIKIPNLGDIVIEILYPTTFQSEMDDFKNILVKIPNNYVQQPIKTIRAIDINLLNCINLSTVYGYYLENTLDYQIEVIITYGHLRSRETLHKLFEEPIVAITTNIEKNEIDFVVNDKNVNIID